MYRECRADDIENTYIGDADTVDTLHVYFSSCSSGPALDIDPISSSLAIIAEVVGDRNALDASALGGCRLTDHVPQCSLGSGLAWTLKESVVRGAKLLTIMA